MKLEEQIKLIIGIDKEDKFDLDVLEDYIEKGLVERNNHPTLPLSIYNYTRECQFKGHWDDITLSCRGLILDQKGYIVARPLKKFFNMEEMKEVPNTSFYVYEKMDGSLGICFYYAGEWHMATRGSFTSEQAIKGREMLQKYLDNPHCDFHPSYTYYFEITYKENRVVVDYDFEDVILLGRKHISAFVSENSVHGEGFVNSFRVVKRYDGIKDYRELKNLVKDNQEGFVVRFHDKHNTRMKIKGDEYVRLHRLLTNFSNVDIWECLKNGDDINKFLERVPDEFDEWVRKKVTELKVGFELVESYCCKIHDYFRYGKYYDCDPEPSKKEFALHIQRKVESKYHAILFAIWDKNSKKVDDCIWKLIRPEYQKPFWNKE